MNKTQKLFLKEMDEQLKKLKAKFEKYDLDLEFNIKTKTETESDPYHWTFSNY